jgi:3-isopropylmalate/(R)-2-methylmalate dehydratase small subunit
MIQVASFTSRVVLLPIANIDTDQIIPARFLKVTDRAGLGEGLFADWRYTPTGAPHPDFVLNQPAARGAVVLFAGDNFGCGSSREHAPWALVGYGFRAVISTFFADIFRNNSLNNGLLPVTVDAAVHRSLQQQLQLHPEAEVTIDLAGQTLTLPDGTKAQFPIDPFARHCLLHGVDQLGFLLGEEQAVLAYEAAHPSRVATTAVRGGAGS